IFAGKFAGLVVGIADHDHLKSVEDFRRRSIDAADRKATNDINRHIRNPTWIAFVKRRERCDPFLEFVSNRVVRKHVKSRLEYAQPTFWGHTHKFKTVSSNIIRNSCRRLLDLGCSLGHAAWTLPVDLGWRHDPAKDAVPYNHEGHR